ncbi:hypothetical protein SELMODRAFT_407780 [Selaginella moellendorffii]|uniref:Uncharacterized protein n=1 Tax=Selaginella moellendorffii TaxID=88036 RepID=D8R6Q6_SELML|nr:hypothetical protein SELMODRAFT_407780 [Selaginella moellendorffii]
MRYPPAPAKRHSHSPAKPTEGHHSPAKPPPSSPEHHGAGHPPPSSPPTKEHPAAEPKRHHGHRRADDGAATGPPPSSSPPNKADTVTWRPRRAGPPSPPPSTITRPLGLGTSPPTAPSAPSLAAAAFVASPGVLVAGIVMLLLALVAIVNGVWILLKRRRNKVHGDIILVEYGHQLGGGNSGSSSSQEHLITKVEPRPSSQLNAGRKKAAADPRILHGQQGSQGNVMMEDPLVVFPANEVDEQPRLFSASRPDPEDDPLFSTGGYSHHPAGEKMAANELQCAYHLDTTGFQSSFMDGNKDERKRDVENSPEITSDENLLWKLTANDPKRVKSNLEVEPSAPGHASLTGTARDKT